jgi:hypothetical protein
VTGAEALGIRQPPAQGQSRPARNLASRDAR